MPRYFRVLQSLTRRLLNHSAAVQPTPSAAETMTNCLQEDLAWVGPLSKAHRQPWYLLLNPNGVATQPFLEPLLTALPHHAEDADRVFHAWIAEQALIIEHRDNAVRPWKPGANRKADGITNGHWQSLCEELRRFRPKHPVHGILLLLDLSWFAHADPTEQQQLRKQVLRTLHEISLQLQTHTRLYVCATHLESIAGYHAWQRLLGAHGAETLLGTHFSQRTPAEWQQELSEFWQQWHRQLIGDQPQLLMQTSHLAVREALFEFQQQIQQLGTITSQWLASTIPLTQPIEMRGFFLGSHGVYSSLATHPQQTLNQRYQLLSEDGAAAQEIPTAACLNELFAEGILPEVTSTPIAAPYRQQHQRQRQTALLAMGLCGMALVAGWYHYFHINRQTGEQLLNQLTSSSRFPPLVQPVERALGLDRLALWEQQPKDQPGSTSMGVLPDWLTDMGLYQGRARQLAMDNNYLDRLYNSLLPGLMRALHDRLLESQAGSDDQMTLLTVMRILDDPQNHHPEWALAYIDQHLDELLNEPGKPAVSAEMRRRVHQHLAYALHHTNWQQARQQGDQEAIQRYAPYATGILTAQSESRRLPMAQRIYQGIRDQARTVLTNPLPLVDDPSEPFTKLLSASDDEAKQVPEWFTSNGLHYLSAHESELMEQATFAYWVLGISDEITTAERQGLVRKIHQIYQHDAAEYWKRAFENLSWSAPSNTEEILVQLALLNDQSQPLAHWLNKLQSHWPDPRITQATIQNDRNKPLGFEMPSPFSKEESYPWYPLVRFAGVGSETNNTISTLQRELGELERYLRPLLTVDDQGFAAWQALKNRASSDPIIQLRLHAQTLPTPLNHWIEELTNNANSQLLQRGVQVLNRRWQQEVMAEYDQRIADRYPFNPRANQDVTLADMEHFFGPNGVFDHFYQEELLTLAPEFENHAKHVSNEANDESAPQIWQALQRSAEQVHQIRSQFFNAQGELEVAFAIQPIRLSANKRRSILNLDGQLIDFHHDQQAEIALIWPNSEEGSGGSKLTLVPTAKEQSPRSIQASGRWAIFRILQQAESRPIDAAETELEFEIDGGKMKYRLLTLAPLIDLKLFSEFKLPRSLE